MWIPLSVVICVLAGRTIVILLFSLGLNGYWQYVVIGTILIAALGVPYLIGRARANSRPELRRAA